MSVFVGLDVGAKTVVMAWRQDGRTVGSVDIAQTVQGHAEAVKRLRALEPTHIVLEATGVYYLDLALALAEAQLAVSVINPKSFHHFARLKLAHSKTDRLDAALLAEYGERMTPARWVPPEPSKLALREIGRQINRLTHAKTQAKNRLHALRAKQQTAALLIEDEEQGIVALEQRIARLSQAALQVMAESPALTRQRQCLEAAKGVATTSAIALLAELCVLPADMRAAQVSRYAGLDVRQCQSGTSVNRPARLSKAGNAYLRAALYMPALSAVTHDKYARAFYEALVRRGKKKIQALCAVMRKYLTGLWACLQQAEPFDSSKLFSEKHLAGA